MYLVVVYDAGPAERPHLRAILKPALHWIQNSVFAGEISKTAAEDLYRQLQDISDQARVTFWMYDRKPATRLIGEQDDEESVFL